MPPAPGKLASDLNGVALPNTCMFPNGQEHHVFVIGDWGGLQPGPGRHPYPADDRKPESPKARPFVPGADNCAQMRVAKQIIKRAADRRVDYVLNSGDTFYWGGVAMHCGTPPTKHPYMPQWVYGYEKVYEGPGITGKPWLGVLGNHDYGGFHFHGGWDQTIAYTWAPPSVGNTGRWVLPAQYWSVKVEYNDFSIDYYFVDTNVFNAHAPTSDGRHNICGFEHNQGESCHATGPKSMNHCPFWFRDLWGKQVKWLEENLAQSTADWQVIVTHFPPRWGTRTWNRLAKKYGIDLFVNGHTHLQWATAATDRYNSVPGSAVLISGGGGGITSESCPNPDGHDDMYGFMDLTLSKDKITVEAISHGGFLRRTIHVEKREPLFGPHEEFHFNMTHQQELASNELEEEMQRLQNSPDEDDHKETLDVVREAARDPVDAAAQGDATAGGLETVAPATHAAPAAPAVPPVGRTAAVPASPASPAAPAAPVVPGHPDVSNVMVVLAGDGRGDAGEAPGAHAKTAHPAVPTSVVRLI